MKSRLLLLTAGYGEGHNAAARALEAAANLEYGPGTATVADIFALSRPRANAYVRRWYLALINRAPGVWRSTYGWLDRSPRAGQLIALLAQERRLLGSLLARVQPEVVCSTYPLYAFMLQRLAWDARVPLPPHANVVTDSISINSLWWRAACTAWYVPNLDSADVLREAGVDPHRIRPLGFPVHPDFAQPAAELPVPGPASGQRPRVLYILNSRTPAAIETARQILQQEDWDITCTVGRNEALRAELDVIAQRRRRPAQVLGWTNEIPRLLLTHHVVVSKAGGATTQEAIAARCPMIVNQIVPGQEEGNYEFLRRHGIGDLAETPAVVIRTLQAAFAENAAVWRKWRASLARVSRPCAAREIVRELLAPGRPAANAEVRTEPTKAGGLG